MNERWKNVKSFPGYKISNFGEIRNEKSGRILLLSQNQYGVQQVGMMRDGVQYHRSVPLLVARAFIPRRFPAFDTPINLDGDRTNNEVDNLVWRPRWFATKYNQQFREPYVYRINDPIENIKTGDISENSLECAKTYGFLEEDLVLSILNRTYVWPTYQEFQIVEQ